MKGDEFAFFNQQLAVQLQSGIPLEEALRQSCAVLARGKMRSEFEKFLGDLTQGVSFPKALAARRLPPFYVQMLEVGVKSGDLPGMLNRLSDYYRQRSSVESRLKSVMLYPVILVAFSLLLSITFAVIISRFTGGVADGLRDYYLGGLNFSAFMVVSMRLAPIFLWGPTILLAGVLLLLVWIRLYGPWRRWLRWRIPTFRDVSLWQFASAMEVLLNGGCRLDEALLLMAKIEDNSPAAREVEHWLEQMAAGCPGFAQMAVPNRTFPRLFLWLVAVDNENLAAGFKEAAEIYQGRATYRIEVLLYAALPVSILAMGIMIFIQIYTMAHFIAVQIMPYLMY